MPIISDLFDMFDFDGAHGDREPSGRSGGHEAVARSAGGLRDDSRSSDRLSGGCSSLTKPFAGHLGIRPFRRARR